MASFLLTIIKICLAIIVCGVVRLQALKKNPGIEWRDGGTGITKDDRTDSGYEGCCSGYICEYPHMNFRQIFTGVYSFRRFF